MMLLRVRLKRYPAPAAVRLCTARQYIDWRRTAKTAGQSRQCLRNSILSNSVLSCRALCRVECRAAAAAGSVAAQTETLLGWCGIHFNVEADL